jgi:hypothetical protein
VLAATVSLVAVDRLTVEEGSGLRLADFSQQESFLAPDRVDQVLNRCLLVRERPVFRK